VLFVVVAVKCVWDSLLGDYVWHVRWPLLALGRPAVLMRVAKPPLLQPARFRLDSPGWCGLPCPIFPALSTHLDGTGHQAMVS
jgi:hypothetical protein